MQIVLDHQHCVLVGNLEDGNMVHQVPVFFAEIVVLLLFGSRRVPICDDNEPSAEVLGVLGLLLEGAASSLEDHEETLGSRLCIWIKIESLGVKVGPVEWSAASQVVLWLRHHELGSPGRSDLDVAKPYVAQFRLDSVHAVLCWKLLRKGLRVHDYQVRGEGSHHEQRCQKLYQFHFLFIIFID